jgi:hypothetical protein
MGHTPFGQPQIIFANKERLALFQSHQQGNMTQYIHEKKPNSGLSTQSLLKRDFNRAMLLNRRIKSTGRLQIQIYI